MAIQALNALFPSENGAFKCQTGIVLALMLNNINGLLWSDPALPALNGSFTLSCGWIFAQRMDAIYFFYQFRGNFNINTVNIFFQLFHRGCTNDI